jgi:lysophospholipase L1-like esterase
VVFIGINDVWWRGTSEAAFEQALRDIIASAETATVRMVLATLTVHGEKPDGTNGDDPKIEIFAQITRDVAADTGCVLVELRKAYIGYLQNYNYQLNADGTLNVASSGFLTYDGVHPTTEGNDLLADHIAEGIYYSAIPEPAAGIALLLLPLLFARCSR